MSRIRNDLDLAWKEALVGFLPDFLALFLPEVHAAVDWTHPADFLEGELRRLHRNLRGRRRHADLVVRVRCRDGQHALVVIHVEVQSQKDSDLGLRMRICNDRLFDRYRCPVYSLAVLGDASPAWRPSGFQVEVWGCRSRLDFPALKLLDWKPRLGELETSSNPFCLVVAAHLAALETRPHQIARLQRAERLVELMLGRGFSQLQVDGLFHVLEAMMPMSEPLLREFHRNVRQFEEEYGMKLITQSERMGLQRGLEQGREQGREQGLEQGREEGRECLRRAVLTVAGARFDQVPDGLSEALEAVTDPEALDRIIRASATVADARKLLDEVRKESAGS